MATGGGSTSGGMDIRQSQETWATFTRVVTWASAAIIILLILMAKFLL